MKKTLLWVVGIVVVVLIVVSVAGKKQTENGPIKVGMITPLTGDLGSLGEIVKVVTEIAVKEINENGGINGRELEIIIEDDQCNTVKAVSAANKLIDVDKVNIVIGSSCSGPVIAMLPITSKSNVLLISGSATSPILDNAKGLFIRIISGDSGGGRILAKKAISNGWKKIGFIQENSEYALGMYNSFTSNYDIDGGEIFKEEYPESTTDFRSILAKIKSKNPDALFIVPHSPTTARRILANLSQLNWNVPIIVNHVISGASDIVDSNSKLLEGAISAEQSTEMLNDQSKTLEEKYIAYTGKPSDYRAYSQAQYDLMKLLADGMKTNGVDSQKLYSWFKNVKDYEGASGKFSIDSNGNRVGGYTLTVIKNGKTIPMTE